MVCFGGVGVESGRSLEVDLLLQDKITLGGAKFRQRFHKANIHLIMLSIEPLNLQMSWHAW